MPTRRAKDDVQPSGKKVFDYADRLINSFSYADAGPPFLHTDTRGKVEMRVRSYVTKIPPPIIDADMVLTTMELFRCVAHKTEGFVNSADDAARGIRISEDGHAQADVGFNLEKQTAFCVFDATQYDRLPIDRMRAGLRRLREEILRAGYVDETTGFFVLRQTPGMGCMSAESFLTAALRREFLIDGVRSPDEPHPLIAAVVAAEAIPRLRELGICKPSHRDRSVPTAGFC